MWKDRKLMNDPYIQGTVGIKVKTFINKGNMINPMILIEFMTPSSDVHREN